MSATQSVNKQPRLENKALGAMMLCKQYQINTELNIIYMMLTNVVLIGWTDVCTRTGNTAIVSIKDTKLNNEQPIQDCS